MIVAIPDGNCHVYSADDQRKHHHQGTRKHAAHKQVFEYGGNGHRNKRNIGRFFHEFTSPFLKVYQQAPGKAMPCPQSGRAAQRGAIATKKNRPWPGRFHGSRVRALNGTVSI
jgi:hypothetical protein